MGRNQIGIMRGIITVMVVTLALGGSTWARTFKVLHRFGHKDGSGPNWNGLIMDSSGVLYGTTRSGGPLGHGDVFKMTANSDGTWTETTVCAFGPRNLGVYPGGPVILDKMGNLYGTTETGGNHGHGIVFELSPNLDGTWTETVLHEFAGSPDGAQPASGLVFDDAGNLYGTTFTGGTSDHGTVFKLTPNGDGTWAESVLVSFAYASGYYPEASLILDNLGNLYGTTSQGGLNGRTSAYGVVFELTSDSGGNWTEHVLYAFKHKKDGANPYAGLTWAGAGALYGVTAGGGAYDQGVVFQMTPESGGGWAYHVVHAFEGADGATPVANVIFDNSGNLFGATIYGGAHGGGVVFKMTPKLTGAWNYHVQHTFVNDQPDGLLLDGSGNLFGTTLRTPSGKGSVFEIMP